MEKLLTSDQKNILQSLENLVQQPWRKILEEYIRETIKHREDMLLWKVPAKDKDWNPIDLDAIRYNANTIMRHENAILYTIVDYPTNIIKKLGVYQTT